MPGHNDLATVLYSAGMRGLGHWDKTAGHIGPTGSKRALGYI